MTQKQVKVKLKEMRRLVDQYLLYLIKSRNNSVKASSLKAKAVQIYKSLPEDTRLLHKNEIDSILKKADLI